MTNIILEKIFSSIQHRQNHNYYLVSKKIEKKKTITPQSLDDRATNNTKRSPNNGHVTFTSLSISHVATRNKRKKKRERNGVIICANKNSARENSRDLIGRRFSVLAHDWSADVYSIFKLTFVVARLALNLFHPHFINARSS